MHGLCVVCLEAQDIFLVMKALPIEKLLILTAASARWGTAFMKSFAEGAEYSVYRCARGD
jgi:hypothetical protein